MATIHDVARISGYSLGTVSNVINHPQNVAPATRARVEAVMADLDYTPNANARNLSLGHNRNIGVVLPNSTLPYFAHIIDGIMQAAFPTGYRITLLPTNYDENQELQYLRELQQKSYAGLIFVSRQIALAQLQSQSAGHQLVVCEDVGDVALSSVYTDRLPTYEDAFRWIQKQGYRDVAVLTQRSPADSQTSADLVTAYRSVFGHDLPDDRLRLGVMTARDGYDVAQYFMTAHAPVDFIFANGDDIAAGVYLAYHDAKREMPGLLGTENQLTSRLLKFPTINHHLSTIGHVAFNLAVRAGVRHQLIKSDFLVH
ncbi:LacI family DNA-binding transcriptional regulator [Lacticaseibacillus pabuli]|uniref:LacI family DNA-binding transcriptional regulator n=1 Tax=Lacticaseibacillus pabuli TaxID=3025672 RepID=A0ABY7WT65_9LACO|nr:LacI family DNA-binding transcriptional regulator [Lacticaseibacillus sp. KACC 23028]WDF83357.1 LacI family DNA-binding transcriptional regulator [Lacticaseibacillus sp. KACC 23028]